jgi:hypothetical protein
MATSQNDPAALRAEIDKLRAELAALRGVVSPEGQEGTQAGKPLVQHIQTRILTPNARPLNIQTRITMTE